MTFSLPNLMPLIVTLLAVVTLAVVTLAVGMGDFFVANHRVRVARQQSIPTYYRRLVLAH